jgi:hypothetical protein
MVARDEKIRRLIPRLAPMNMEISTVETQREFIKG